MNINERSISYSSISVVPSIGVRICPIPRLGIKMDVGMMMLLCRYNTKWKTEHKDQGFLYSYLPEMKIAMFYVF